MKNTRPNSYLGTFVNTPEGISSYKLMVKHIREVVTGGRFVKMFRGSPRSFTIHEYQGSWQILKNIKSDTFKVYSGTSLKEKSTHFDVYLLDRGWKNRPKFFNFELK